VNAPAQGVLVAFQRAGAFYELGRFGEAAEVLRQALISDPHEPHAWSLLSAAELGEGKPSRPSKPPKERSRWIPRPSGLTAWPASRCDASTAISEASSTLAKRSASSRTAGRR
jgi:hypothetical protein